MIKIYNTLSRNLEDFEPYDPDNVGMYACGPTVYDYAHIGHCRKYTNDDLIKRSLRYLGFNVKHVMNITDVGHLVSDSDEGEDKMEKGAKKQGKTVWEVAEFFTQDFMNVMNSMNILPPDIVCKATDHIQQQINMIKILVEKGYAYETEEAVYFEVSKFHEYTKLNRQNLDEKSIGARDEVKVDPRKKHPADFALWFKRVGKFANHSMHWDSPWGDGFPGWHIECSAMSMHYLGDQFDIHTGGVDHIAVHHTNEIAQSECSSGKTPFVKYWIHHEHLMINGEKMSKSSGNYYRLADLEEKGFSPMDLRYFFLNASYRIPQNFTFDALVSAKNSRERMVRIVNDIVKKSNHLNRISNSLNTINSDMKSKFVEALSNDFNIPAALSIAWEVLRSSITDESKIATILDFDRVFGLNLFSSIEDPHELNIPPKAKELIELRNKARKVQDWQTADEIRQRLLDEFGIKVTDN